MLGTKPVTSGIHEFGAPSRKMEELKISARKENKNGGKIPKIKHDEWAKRLKLGSRGKSRLK